MTPPATATDNFATARQARRTRLDDLQTTVQEWKDHVLVAFADPANRKLTGKAFNERRKETLRRYKELRDSVRDEDFDPVILSQVFEIMVDGLALAADPGERGPIDLFDDLIVRLERLRRLIQDAIDDHVYTIGTDQKAVIRQVTQWLPSAKQSELAALCGISTKQLSRWAEGDSAPNERLTTVAKLVAILRRSWSERGVLLWFERPREELGGQTPHEVLDSDSDVSVLIDLARHGLSQRGT